MSTAVADDEPRRFPAPGGPRGDDLLELLLAEAHARMSAVLRRVAKIPVAYGRSPFSERN